MPNPLIFFIFIIIIDLVLKSVKDKKKIERTNQKRDGEIESKPVKPKPMMDLRKILEEELEKERQREVARRQGKTMENQKIKPMRTEIKKEKEIIRKQEVNRNSWDIMEEEKKNLEVSKPIASKVENNGRNFKQDILRGIIFSEILSEPKSIQNQKRSS